MGNGRIKVLEMTIFIIFMLTTIILMKVFQNDIVGFIGERFTANNIKTISNGIVFTDIYANGSHGVQQIDIIAITKKGIIVVEKKTYIGLILGKSHDKQWKVILAKGKQKYPIKNPHHQNYGHIQALLENYPQMNGKIVDLVIFGNNAKLGDNIPDGTICDAGFKKFYNSLPDILNSSQMNDYVQLIEDLRQNRASNKKLHKQKIRNLKRH